MDRFLDIEMLLSNVGKDKTTRACRRSTTSSGTTKLGDMMTVSR
jgi:hypothetical protein